VGDTRHKNAKWSLTEKPTTDLAMLGLLMDLRDELQSIGMQNARLLNILECKNFLNVPRTLRTIARNTAKYRCRSCPRTFESVRGLDQHVRRATDKAHL